MHGHKFTYLLIDASWHKSSTYKGMKHSTLGLRGHSKVRVAEAKHRVGGLAEASFSTLLGQVAFLLILGAFNCICGLYVILSIYAILFSLRDDC